MVITDVDVVNGKSSEVELQVTSLKRNQIAMMISDLEYRNCDLLPLADLM